MIFLCNKIIILFYFIIIFFLPNKFHHSFVFSSTNHNTTRVVHKPVRSHTNHRQTTKPSTICAAFASLRLPKPRRCCTHRPRQRGALRHCFPRSGQKRVRSPGIEPGSTRWQRAILPLDQLRLPVYGDLDTGHIFTVC